MGKRGFKPGFVNVDCPNKKCKEYMLIKLNLMNCGLMSPKKTYPSMECRSENERWVWLSFSKEHRLILSAYLGYMTQKSEEVVNQA